MRRFFLVPLFALGAVIGFGSELRSHGASSCHWQDRQAAYEQRIADTCANAAVAAQRNAQAPVTPTVAQAPAPAPVAPANVPVVIVNTLPGQGAPQPLIYPGGYGYPQLPVQYVPVQQLPQAAPAPGTSATAPTTPSK